MPIKFKPTINLKAITSHRSKITGLLVLALLTIGVVLASRLPDSSSRGSQYQVELRADGFYPPDLTIKKGDSVTFTTSRANFFWPASDIHPTHGLYPGFDPKAPVDPTKSWTFKFSQVGAWKFHDHLAPSFRGVITVVDEKTKTSSKTELSPQCPPSSPGPIPVQCRKEELLKILESEGLDKTFQKIAEIYQSGNELPGSCHGIAHEVGHSAYRSYQKNKDSLFSPKASYCASGFYHGFMASLLGATRNIPESRQFCLQVKDKLTALAPDSYLQCFHGIGHGAVDYTLGTGLRPNGEEKALLEPALKLCQVASQTEQELYRCASGAFNAVANMYISGQYGLKPKVNDPLWICRIQPDKYKESCYGNMNSYLIYLTNQDLGEALKFVSSLDGGYADKAVWYLSGLASANNLLSFDPVKIDSQLTACRKLSPNLKRACLEGLTQGFLEHGTPSLEYLDVIKFCGLDQLTSEEKEICYSFALGGLQGWYSIEKGTKICRELAAEIRKYCNPSLL